MAIPRRKLELPAIGQKCSVRYAVDAGRNHPAADFMENELTEEEQSKMVALFQWIADAGKICNLEKFKKLTGCENIYEFKHKQIRIGCFQSGNSWFLTHGFRKKRRDWPKDEIERAERIRSEHLKQANRLKSV